MKNINQRKLNRKLSLRYKKPFQIIKRIGDASLAYELDMLEARIHKVFPISLLEPYKSEGISLPDCNEFEGNNVYDVERILDQREYGKIRKYLIQ